MSTAHQEPASGRAADGRPDGSLGDDAVHAAYGADGSVEVIAPAYELTVAAEGLTARLTARRAHERPEQPYGSHGQPPDDAARPGEGRRTATYGAPLLLQLAGAVDRLGADDETLSVCAPHLESEPPHPWPRVTVSRRSTAWRHAVTRIDCTPRGPQLRWEVTGSGRVTSVLPFAVRAALGGRGGGLRPSGHDWRTLFTPNPGPPRRLTRGAGESAVVGAYGDARPGRGHWFFTPAPLCLALTEEELPDDTDLSNPAGDDPSAPGDWWTIGLGDPVDRLTFTQLAYVPSDSGFHLRLDYEGHTRTEHPDGARGGEDGTAEGDAGQAAFTSPAVLLAPGHPDPYSGLRAHREWLSGHGWAAAPGRDRPPARRPGWWREPMFCGWGAQSARAKETRRPAPDLSTQQEYDAHLALLDAHGLDPGTVVVDDKWQRAYGSWEPDRAKWPDLRGWIGERHAEGRKVLLWWRAWATEGVPDELCVRTPDGRPVALDPDHPGARRLLDGNILRMLSPAPGGLGADGLKIDFTADTPSGASLVSHGPHWGIALLHRQLAVIHAAAKRAKPDALVVTHTPHPAFADVTDMIRLNDMLRLDDPDPYARIVPQMRLRAAVAEAACPGLLIDTDDWCAPDREQWREYCAVKHELGVPALYVVSRLDRTGEELAEDDYAALRRSWARWREGGRAGPGGQAARAPDAEDGRKTRS
ncbi:hypothetical protein [Streptomyces marispadix]|uniref:Uncharacterized protein n=1 Tax=Streptomyces marispadix TaxID=2922868 RepID=A0ABS9T561_9ACTN|nr:hypothetical protein [Streptomyces marispadix]MCH6163669.1 hypothetical protein [Streptomyces marispadix]